MLKHAMVQFLLGRNVSQAKHLHIEEWVNKR